MTKNDYFQALLFMAQSHNFHPVYEELAHPRVNRVTPPHRQELGPPAESGIG